MKQASLELSYMEAAFTTEVRGSFEVLEASADAAVRLDPAGWFLVASVDPNREVAGISLPTVTVAMADHPLKLDVGDFGIDLPSELSTFALAPMTLTGLVTIDMPTEIADAVPKESRVGLGSFEIGGVTDIDIDLAVALPADWYIYGDARSATSMRLTRAEFRLSSATGAVRLEIAGGAELTFDSMEGERVELNLVVGVGISAGATGAEVTGTLSLDAPGGWNNAFGVDGLTVLTLDLKLGIGVTGPSLGAAGSVVLPAELRDPLGMSDDAVVTLAANLDADSPCFLIEATGSPALSLGEGAVTADQLKLGVAPTGCSDRSIQAGSGLQRPDDR